MRRSLLKILIVIFGLMSLSVMYLGINQNHRNHIFSILSEAPSHYIDYKLKSGYLNSASGKNYSEISKLLYWQFDLIRQYHSGTGVQLSGLMENTRLVVEQMSFERDGISLAPFLKDLVSYQPKSFEANLWASRALLSTSPKDALIYANNAQKLLPSDTRSYEVMMNVALRLDDSELINKVCKLYDREGSLGSYQPAKFKTLFAGYGVSKLGLEIMSSSNLLLFFELPRMSIGNNQKYVLDFNSVQNLQDVKFHLRLPVGHTIMINNLKLFRSGKLVAAINGVDLQFVGRGGFFDEKSNFIIVGKNQTLTLKNSSSFYKNERLSDQLRLNISIGKLSPASPNFCEG